jgi:hypothetical protein
MSQLTRNSNRMALLVGRTFELRVPHSVETCIARLEKKAAGEPKLGVRFSKVNEGFYEFELVFGGFGVEAVGHARLEDMGDGHTLVAGQIGKASITNVIIGVGIVIFIIEVATIWNLNSGLGLACGVSLVIFVVYVIVGRLSTFDKWLRWVQEALDE